MLFDRQRALLHRWASPAFVRALAELGLHRNALPNLVQISRVVQQRTGWTLLLTGYPVSEAAYYAALARRELLVVSRLRSFSEFDQPPGGPDLFADLFGRVPLLLEPGYAEALCELGRAWELGTTPAAMGLLRRFTRATLERGLLAAASQRPTFYGAALLTSARHLHAAAAIDAVDYQPLSNAVRYFSQPELPEASLTAVGPDVYFVTEGWADLTAAIQQLRLELVDAQREAVASHFATVLAAADGRNRAFAARLAGLR